MMLKRVYRSAGIPVPALQSTVGGSVKKGDDATFGHAKSLSRLGGLREESTKNAEFRTNQVDSVDLI
jgi:hypothetical protein